jgi:tetratricopeptide (TPR) repeat protein
MTMRSPRRILLLVACSLALAGRVQAAPPTPSPAPADAEASSKAKAFYEQGMAHYHLEEYDRAIEKWEEGFRVRPVPEFLYNIAQAHRLSKRPDKALRFYKKYLQISPSAPNRGEVERHIAQLERLVKETTSSAQSPPSTTREPMPGTSATPAPSGTASAPPSTPPAGSPESPSPPAASPAPTETVVAAPPPKKPLYKKGWFWGVIGGSIAAVVVVGVVVGVVAGRDQPEVLPAVRF